MLSEKEMRHLILDCIEIAEVHGCFFDTVPWDQVARYINELFVLKELKNMEDKANLMKQLIDLYDQRNFIDNQNVFIINEFILKKEKELMELLKNGQDN